MSILDEMVLVPPHIQPLNSRRPLRDRESSTRLTASLFPHPRSSFQLSVPWILGSTHRAQAGPSWNTLCQRIKSMGTAIQCPLEDLESVPMEAIPLRIACQPNEQPISIANLQSADFVELTCRSSMDETWGWPPEIGQVENLSAWVESIRIACGGSTPLALGLPVGVDSQAIREFARSTADVLAIHAEACSSDELIVETLTRARSILNESEGSRRPILLRSSHTSPEHLVKLLALGASIITIDSALADLWKTQVETPIGFLSRVQAGMPASAECPILARIQLLSHSLLSALAPFPSDSNSFEATAIGSLRQRLRATSARAARLANIPHLGD